jgi:prevent-host-death family protein
MKVRLDQIVPIKQAQQTLPKLMRRLADGEGPLVLTRRGEPVAIMSPYRELEECERCGQHFEPPVTRNHSAEDCIAAQQSGI